MSATRTVMTPPPGARRVTYDAIARVEEDGTGMSVETTTWHDACAEAVMLQPLDDAARRAALAYVNLLGPITRGLVTTTPHVTRMEDAPAIRLRGLGVTLLQFGPMRQLAPGHYALPVHGGLLSGRPPATTPEEANGALEFVWTRTGRDERFETILSGFSPTIVGATGAPGSAARSALYNLTQMNAHRFTMWQYHRWVQHHRARLLHGRHGGETR